MKLVRNTTIDGTCKYAIIRLDELERLYATEIGLEAFNMDDGFYRVPIRVVENPKIGDPEECFVLKLKDVHSKAALMAYASSIRPHDREFAGEVEALAARSGVDHPQAKEPD